jgi:hypothetical protein
VLLRQEDLSRPAVGDLAQDRVSRARAHRRLIPGRPSYHAVTP